MLLSRFWYIVCALIIGALSALLFIAATLYNRSGDRAMREALAADSSAVHWYLKDDSRNRAAALIQIALNGDVQTGLAKATGEAKPSREVRDKMKAALRKLEGDVPADLKFDALWAVDANGRVIGAAGFEHSEDWELGGYPVVADALHGWIRDDAWVWKGRIYRVVARPVEKEAGSEPVGAIVGAKIVDDAFAKAVSKRTEAAVAFYAEGQRVASGAPEGFDKSNLDVITKDIKELEGNEDYHQKGRSEARVIGEHLGVVYARMPGEAWELGAGYAVGRLAVFVETPFDFFRRADNTDKSNVKLPILAGIVVVIAGLGLFFSWLEHSRPLGTFRHEVARLGKGEIDSLQPSRFRGIYKKVAADVNDGVEKVAVKGGAPRRAADLESVLGPLPAQPAMSAFSVPGGAVPASEPSHDSQSFPRPVPQARNSGGGAPRLRSGPASNPAPPMNYGAGAPMAPEPSTGTPMDVAFAPPANTPAPAPVAQAAPPPAPSRAGPPPPLRPKPPLPAQATPAPVPAAPSTLSSAVHAASMPGAAPEPVVDELTDWRRVYEEFLSVKKQCNEPVGALTFEKFQRTLQRNKDALVQHHGCERVKFTVYVKDGKAALKASPVEMSVPMAIELERRSASVRARRRAVRSALLALGIGGGLVAGRAEASTGIESPDNGVVQVGRGGAWVARADDPLAVFFNPAALARQATGVHLGAHLMFLDRCYTRLGPDQDGDGKGDPVAVADGVPAPGTPGGPDAATCDEGGAFPNPQLAFVWRVTPDLGIGLAVLGPHAVGGTEYPETVPYTDSFGNAAEQPFAGRYLVTQGDSVLILPTISAGYAVTDWLSVGAGFIWGIATLEYSNFSEALSPAPGAGQQPSDSFFDHGDVKATLKATDAFIPGFVIGGLAEVTSRLDVGFWFKWMDAVDSDADINTESRYWQGNGKKNDQPCLPSEAPDCNITDPEDKEGHLHFPTPMEARLGVRYHHPRPGIRPRWAQRADGGRVRDPLSEDLFDIEVDFTWANNSAVDTLELRFPGRGGLEGAEIPVNGTPGGVIPGNADVPHEWKDVFGVRLGGDFVVLPNLLALRAGGFVETKGQDDKYLNLDFHVGEKVGLGGGATVRVGPVDISAAFQHTFYGDIDNNGVGAIFGLSGDATTSDNRTRQTVNGGVLTSSLNEVALGGTLRF